MPENLWPDFDMGKAPPSPKAVIQKAGNGLSKKTGGLVNFYVGQASIRDNRVDLECSLFSPVLLYHYPFLRAQFLVEPVYPVRLVADKMPEIVANNEEELIEALTKIFNAPSTVTTVQRLMSLSRG